MEQQNSSASRVGIEGRFCAAKTSPALVLCACAGENKVKEGDVVAADPLGKGSQLAADNNGGKILKLGRGRWAHCFFSFLIGLINAPLRRVFEFCLMEHECIVCTGN